jgi:malonyl-CoA O-methyltransferase
MLAAPHGGYRLWSPHYDEAPNPLLALESRLLEPRLGSLDGLRVLDAGCGTGRWMTALAERGAHVFGIDCCDSMIAQAAAKPALRGCCSIADITKIPTRDDSFDLAICSFALSYTPRLNTALSELARVARSVLISDLHPDAMSRGWTRSFRAEGRVWEIEHFAYTADALDHAASGAGLVRQWRIESPFGEPERDIFLRAGKEAAFAETARDPAVLITSWTR